MKNPRIFNSKSLRFSISKSKFSVNNLFANVLVKQHGSIVRHIIRMIYALKGKLTPNWTRLCYFFIAKCIEVKKGHGTGGLIKFLKTSATLLQQVPAGYRVPDVTLLGFRLGRTHSGLPKWIPSYQRKLISSRDPVTIKRWLTLCNLYRVIPLEGRIKLSSIIKPSSSVSSSYELRRYLKPFSSFFDIKRLLLSSFDNPNFPSQILTSAPQSMGKTMKDFSTNIGSAYRSLRLLRTNKFQPLLSAIFTVLHELNSHPVLELMRRANQYLNLNKFDSSSYKPSPSKGLGALRFKEEAAGKVRVFAMVDPWTQWALKPLHKALFKILRQVPMDGTFDQLKPLSRIPWGKVPLYSFDLSAATDRLPIWIQSDILSQVFGEKFAQAWSTLLVGRSYSLPKLDPKRGLNFKGTYPDKVTYSVGQPMGALSSWAMLAITHHFIVQASAWKAGVLRTGLVFKEYALLGDDILIWNKPVAIQYQKYMSQLGVEIGLSKSILSPSGKGLEFAKRTILGGTDVSPIPFKEVSAAHRNFANMRSFMDKYNLSLNNVIRLLGYGYKVDSTKNTKLVRALNIGLSIPRTHTELVSLFMKHSPHSFPTTIPITSKAEGANLLYQFIWASQYDRQSVIALVTFLLAESRLLDIELIKAIKKLEKYYEITEQVIPVPFSTVLKEGRWTGLSPKWGYVNVPFILQMPDVDPHLDRLVSARVSRKDWSSLEPSLFQWSVTASKASEAYNGLKSLRYDLHQHLQEAAQRGIATLVYTKLGSIPPFYARPDLPYMPMLFSTGTFGVGNELSALNAEFLASFLLLLFKAHDELDSFQVDKLITPEPSQGQTDPTFLELERTIKSWNRWSRVISSLDAMTNPKKVKK